MKPCPPEPSPDVASGRSGIHPCSATGDQCDTGHLSQCQLWGSGVGTQSKEASGASHKGKAHLPGSRRRWLMSWLSPAGPTATAPLCRMSLAIQTTALRDPSSSSFHSPLPLWLLPKTEILHNLLMDLAQGRFSKAQMGDGISFPSAVDTQSFPRTGGSTNILQHPHKVALHSSPGIS